jgi:signal peptidase I
VPVLGAIALVLMVSLPVAILNLVPILLPFGLQLASIVDAVRDARTPGRDGGRPWYSRAYICAVLVLGNVLGWAPAQAAALRTTLVQAFKIPTGGMEPTILIGDHLLVDKFTYGLRSPLSGAMMLRRREPRRGEVVAFLFPEQRSRIFLKRVIGLPGETIDIQAKQVFVDGRPIQEPYAHFISEAPVPGVAGPWVPVTVPAAHLFVLGDNRDYSHDSRHWGFVPIDDVLGEAKVVYFSVAYARDGSPYMRFLRVRWLRLGKILG